MRTHVFPGCIRVLRRLRDEETGAVVAVEVMLLLLIMGIGLIAGMSSMRDGISQELADTGLAVNNLNQGYTLTGVTNAGGDSANGSTFDDNPDENDGADPSGSEAPGLDIDGNAPASE